MPRVFAALGVVLLAGWALAALAGEGTSPVPSGGPLDPYYPHRGFPKLTTPEWVGEAGVECVVTLAIDDMRDPARYEAFLRPILDRLKQIDGRAAVSIMTCRVNPADPQLQAWLQEGLSIECHTYDHPCPLLQDGGLAKAKETYDKCVDLMHQIPGNQPVAFRVPCCDSKNTPTPRFWAEIFGQTTPSGHSLQIDSSVFNLITSQDRELPEEITKLPDGSERFRRYVPFPNFVNTIEDYPYPYVIGGTCWEFPCVVPSDWSAQHVQGPHNPDTVRDWKLALDACVLKQGVFNLVFHPHGWIKPQQIVELIDHAVARHGRKVKFLTFRECAQRLNRRFGPLRGQAPPLATTREAIPNLPPAWRLPPSRLPPPVPFDAQRDTGLRLVDVNGDGAVDCLFSDHRRYALYLFDKAQGGWTTAIFDVLRGQEDGTRPVLPPFVRADGTNNGAWIHSGAVWLMNEDTWRLPDHVFKLTFAELLAGSPAARGRPENPTQGKSSATPAQGAPPAARAAAPPDDTLAGPRFDTLAMTPPRSPEASLAVLHVRPGMQVELVAAEPLVVDPVAFDWGPDGRLWVVEMRDYPNGITWHKEGDELGKPGGRIKVLEDRDGDGRYDTAHVFLDEIPFPTGVKVWREGILVTAAPSIFYAEDRDGDQRADVRIELYRGFGEGNQQHRVNGLRWGLDNWLHVGNGDSGGVIEALGGLQDARANVLRLAAGGVTDVAEATGPRPRVNVGGRDLRIRPDEGLLDPTSGNTQFGRERDDWEHWFGGNNSNPIWLYALDDFYLRRNPHVAYPSVRKAVSVAPGAAPVFPRSATLPRFNDFAMANRFTSACSPMIYRDELLGPEFYGNYFVCEPVHNLVHREPMEPQGTVFVSRRAPDEQTSEFLASEDHWFRPSMCRTGPDGALWVADMYRFVIEHPRWIPEAAQKKLDLRAGDDKGRIYRVFPAGQRPRPIPRLDQLDTAGLVAALDTPNGPQRDLVHQMLLWRQDRSAVPLLTRLARSASRPQVRLQALAVLDGLKALTPSLLEPCLQDSHPQVRRHAVRLAEMHWQQAPALFSAVLARAADDDLQVQMQVAYTLGQTDDPRAAEALGQLLASPAATDPYLAAAALSSLHRHNIAQVWRAVLPSPHVSDDLIQKVATTLAALADESLLAEAASALRPREGQLSLRQLAAAAGLLSAWQQRRATAAAPLSAQSPLAELMTSARKLAGQTQTDPKLRVAAIRLLALAGPLAQPGDTPLLGELLGPQQPAAVQLAAAAALAGSRDPAALGVLLPGWAGYTPAVRGQLLEGLLSREEGALAVLAAIERGQMEATQLDARRRQQLLTARSTAVRRRAEQVLASAVDADRQKVIDAYLPVVAAGGQPERGQELFSRRCGQCHRLHGAGFAVGPDLTPLTTRPADYWLTQILDPNRAVEDRYREYLVLTTDGRQLQGLLAEETGAGLTLLAPEGKQYHLSRDQIEQLRSSGKSLMPEGIERDLPPQEMADLVAFLRASSPPPKEIPGNRPEVVQPFVADGSLRLLATNARIYGPTLTLEEKYRNLGWWQSPEDHAIWTFEVPPDGAGSYRVTLDYACANPAAGNVVVIEVAGQTLSAVVPGTGSWDEFRGWTLGTVQLAAGRGELVVRSGGPIKQALLDLRSVRLTPVR